MAVITHPDYYQEIKNRLYNIVGKFDYNYNYDLTASNYNPNIDSSVTITVKVTNKHGTLIPNHSFDLYKNGSKLTTLTTNSNGVASYVFTTDTWGLCEFSVKTYKTRINTQGWKLVQTTYNNQVNVYKNNNLIYITCTGTWTLNAYNWGAININAGYRPKFPLRVPAQTISDWAEQLILNEWGQLVASNNLTNYKVNATFFYSI